MEQRLFEKELTTINPTWLQDYVNAADKEGWDERKIEIKLREAILN